MKKIITLITLTLCVSACEVHHYHDEPEPVLYETVYYEPEPIVYTTTEYIETVEYVEVVDESSTNYEWYDCWGTVTPFQWSMDKLIYCDAYTCCTWADHNCEVTYCYEPDVCGWHYALDVCYY